MPWAHTVFGNPKTWLRGTFRGARPQHLQRYLGEFRYCFDRRWREGELFGFVLHRGVRGLPLPQRRLVAEGRYGQASTKRASRSRRRATKP